ncbi:MAG: hypothetical protein ACRCWB_11540 [Enterovibrio sp.]
MFSPFKRQLGAESGVQLNPLQDNSELPAGSNSDQVFAIAMRATRGRTDRAFLVDKSNVRLKLGSGESMRKNSLNEAWVQTVEALNNGAYGAVVARLIGQDAKLSSIVVSIRDVIEPPPPEPELPPEQPDQETQRYVAPRSGQKVGTEFSFLVSDSAPSEGYFMLIKHHDCFNDGIVISLHADEVREGGASVPNELITIKFSDANGLKLGEFTGSLIMGARDDNGNSLYLPDVVANLSDSFEIELGDQAMPIAPDSPIYGYGSGAQKWVVSEPLIYFTEGATEYSMEDVQRAVGLLEKSQYDYGFIVSGGSKNTSLMSALFGLMHNVNRQFRFDIDGRLTPEQAISWIEEINAAGQKSAHLAHAFWAPFKSNDPTGINARDYFGTAALNVANACARNAQTNAKGFAKKNFPIAGRDWPVSRSGINQTATPTDPEMDQLAKAKINPVIYSVYSGGGRFVWFDSLTCAPVSNSLKKLIAVADMSSTIDDAVTRFAKDALQRPMKMSIKMTTDFLQSLFEAAEASDWIVPSNDPAMGGAAFRFEVKPNEASPYDRMDVNYWLRYDGTNRQTFVTQTISK